MTDRYPIRHDIPIPTRKRIDRTTRMGPKPSRLTLTMEDMIPGDSTDVPLADFESVPTIPRLLKNIAARAREAWGAGCFTTQGHEDFVRVWRTA